MYEVERQVREKVYEELMEEANTINKHVNRYTEMQDYEAARDLEIEAGIYVDAARIARGEDE